MKNVINLSFVLLLTVVFLSSCNKEKVAVKKLDGSWEMTDYKETPEPVDCGTTDEELVWEFTAYNVGDEESGEGKITVTSDGDTFVSEFTYKVDKKAETLEITTDNGGSNDVTELEIVSLKKNKMELKTVQTMTVPTDCNGNVESKEVTTIVTLEKKE